MRYPKSNLDPKGIFHFCLYNIKHLKPCKPYSVTLLQKESLISMISYCNLKFKPVSNSINCDSCDGWVHLRCSGLTKENSMHFLFPRIHGIVDHASIKYFLLTQLTTINN